MVFTHGGPITAMLYDHDVHEMPNTGSFMGVTFDEENIQDGKIKSLEFIWEFPVVQDDI